VNITTDLVPLFVKQFEMSKVSKGEVVAVLHETQSRKEYVESAEIAASMLGAHVISVSVPGMGWDSPGILRGMFMGIPSITQNNELLEAVKGALSKSDFIVDLISETLLHIPLREELLKENKRIITIVESPDVLERLFPTSEIKERVLKVRNLLEQSKTLHLTSESGTDLYYELIQGSGGKQYGFADKQGHWDNWPSALVSSYPEDGKVEGKLIISPGDMIFPLKRYVTEKITLEIKNGYITSIKGGFDADLMKDFIDKWEDPELYSISHMGFGLHPKAQWNALAIYNREEISGMDARSMEGGFIFSTGPNRHLGKWSEVHFDICMRNMSVSLDKQKVIEQGKFIWSAF